MTLAEKLYSLRRKNGLSQELLAQELNVSRQAISKWEAGQSVPESEKLLLISRYFRVSLDYLMKDEQTEEENGTPAVGSEQPLQNGRKTWLPGTVISLSGILGLIVWGILYHPDRRERHFSDPLRGRYCFRRRFAPEKQQTITNGRFDHENAIHDFQMPIPDFVPHDVRGGCVSLLRSDMEHSVCRIFRTGGNRFVLCRSVSCGNCRLRVAGGCIAKEKHRQVIKKQAPERENPRLFA